MASRTKKVSDKPQVTITDEQYQQFLANRLAAMKGFEAGEVSLEDMKAARAIVRSARKVRKAEAQQLQALREWEAAQAQARSEAAKKAASTRRARKASPAPESTESVPAQAA